MTLRRGPASWRLVHTEPAAGVWNMAVDEALMESVREGGAPALRFYRWSPACLSFGRNQPARGIYRAEAMAETGVDVVRRPTGGRAVLHDEELTYSVVAPAGLLGGPRAAYHRVNAVLLDGLRRLGVRADVQAGTGSPTPLPSTAPCFADPLPGELLLGRRKLVGSAQAHRGGVLLQHGSILLRRSRLASRLEAALGVPVEGEAAYLDEATREPLAVEPLAAALAAAWAEHVAPPAPTPLTDAEAARARALAARFADDRWTWRR